jgi:hypothetical protein
MRKFIASLILILFTACAAAAPTTVSPTPTMVPPTLAPASTPPPLFDFSQGATWTFAGVVQWDAQGKTQQKSLTWKMQVVDQIARDDSIVVYVMRGHPLDLAFYEEGKPPSDYLYVVKANRVYQITLLDNQPITRAKNARDALADWLTDDNLVFDFPLGVDKKFGPAQFLADGMYCWVVVAAKPATLSGIKGVAPVNATEYALDFKTNPDRQTVYFVPGIGITRFVYHHNGTLSDVDVKLVEYAAGGTVK